VDDYKWLEFLGIFIFFGINIIFVYLAYLSRKKYSEALRLVVQKLGLSFEKTTNINIEHTFGIFRLFSQGHTKRIRNRMWGKINGIDIMLFEYSYKVGYGKHSTRYIQTVLILDSSKMHLPAFFLRPENFIDKIGQMFGYEDIDFETHPEFSKSYLLQGKDKIRIRDIFTLNVLSFFERHKGKGMCIEGHGSTLLYYRQLIFHKPEEIMTFLEEGESLHRLFSGD